RRVVGDEEHVVRPECNGPDRSDVRRPRLQPILTHGTKPPEVEFVGQPTQVAAATAFATGVPSKKLGLLVTYTRAGFSNTKSRKSRSVNTPSSTSFHAPATTRSMCGTSQWPMSELNMALMRAPKALAVENAKAAVRSSASQPK